MFEAALDFLKNNQFASGGLMVGIMAAVLAYVRNLPHYFWTLYLRNFTINLTFTNSETTFEWIRLWFTTHAYNKSCTNLLYIRGADSEDGERKGVLVPSYGRHYFWHEYRLVILDYTYAERHTGYGLQEMINMRIFSTNRKLIDNLVENARKYYVSGQTDSTKIFTLRYDDFSLLTTRKIRPNGPILPENKFEEVVADIERFYDSEQVYLDRGINYKRGVLLYGAAGNGKGSTILAVAQKLKKDIVLVNLAGAISDNQLTHAFSNLPPNCIVAFEEIDTFAGAQEREGKDDDGNPVKLTLGCVLNLLDGLITRHGMVVFATTNHIEKLDKALIRPGRMDLKVEFKNATKDQAARLFQRFHPDSDRAAEFAAKVSDFQYSMATLESHLITNPTVEEVLERPIHV